MGQDGPRKEGWHLLSVYRVPGTALLLRVDPLAPPQQPSQAQNYYYDAILQETERLNGLLTSAS